MVGPSHSHQQTTLHKVFSMKLWPAASSTSSSMKIKALIHSLIISHVCRVIRALSKAKAILIQILKENQPIQQLMYPHKSKNKKIFFGSFRLHYNWCSSSSHVMPVPAPAMDEFLYYDSTWNSIISSADDQEGASSPSQLSGYLQWLEEKVQDSTNGTCTEQEKNEIDKLADMFIANCHEKFRLEKVESYRRFQEMLARSM